MARTFFRNFECYGTGNDSAADNINRVLEENQGVEVKNMWPITIGFIGDVHCPGIMVEFYDHTPSER